MHIAILGRQPALGMAELERLYGPDAVRWFSDTAATISTASFSIDSLGGAQKAGRVVFDLPHADWRDVNAKITHRYAHSWAQSEGKVTLGISAYGFSIPPRDVQKIGLTLKSQLKKNGVNLRLIPNVDVALSTATSHHNKLGLSSNKVELLIVRSRSGRVIVAESIGSQNITAYARRDQGRPKRDAFVGMLPPKLAQIMINLATPHHPSRPFFLSPVPVANAPTGSGRQEEGRSDDSHQYRVLDPFCGTGVVLQEAALMGCRVYGTDLSDKMIDYSRGNLDWLATIQHRPIDYTLHQGDATTTTWQPPIDAVVCESYLGQPFSAPPSPSKLEQVRGNCNHIISEFLQNIARQITSGTPLCIAVPAWRDAHGSFHHLPLIRQLEALGYSRIQLRNVKDEELLYYREDQVVARELLVLVKS
ncbi:methyltransferase domain-containing protein [Streptomyces caniscabiei]|uniref:TRM11 family SAM-dependent methyltransferase n=1 Tax=Streptomyces caniscabiei TaxID=2746961 RepID=UPI0029A14DCF|nr:methyltransferase domain-containing protein [Streptomyces caniscabiei]MDX2776196.1 methyltransferase domain-containing protein [Streptomyces caniscabiei]